MLCMFTSLRIRVDAGARDCLFDRAVYTCFYVCMRTTTRDAYLHILQQVAQARPHLLCAGHDLSRRQDESIATSVSELDRHAERCLGDFKSVVHTIATNLVDGVADWASGEDSAVDSFDSSDGAVGQGLVLGGVGDGAGTCVAVWVHPELRVRVDVHVKLDALSGTDAVEVRFQCLGFCAIAGGRALVVLFAGRSASSTTLVPVVRPVPVDVSSDAASCWCGLTVLAPHAVSGLGVGEAIRVNNGEDVKVVFVLVSSGSGVGGAKELVCCILDDPAKSFSSVLVWPGRRTYMVVIHSRAWTVPCHTTPFFDPFPPLPQM
jgi:hypothetical protein